MMSTDGERCGYLDVKVPAKSRGKGIKAWKAWRRRWVVVQGMANLTTGRQLVTIDLYSQLQPDRVDVGRRLQQRTTVCLEGAVSVRRTHSKSHPYAFAVQAGSDDDGGGERDYDEDHASIHLSGYTETDSQAWIRALRCVLRNAGTSTPPSPLRASIGQVFESSLIECLSDGYGTGRHRLAGPVGYIVVLPSVLLLASLEDGCILAELPASTVERVALAQNVPHPEDKDKIVAIEVTGSAVSTGGRLRFFSEKAKDIVATLTNWKIKDQDQNERPVPAEVLVSMSEQNVDATTNLDEEASIQISADQIEETDTALQTIANRVVRCRRTSMFSRKSHLSGGFYDGAGQKTIASCSSTSVRLTSSTLNRRLSRSDSDLCNSESAYLSTGCPQFTVTGCMVETSKQEEAEVRCDDESALNTTTAGGLVKQPLLKLEEIGVQRPLSQVSNDSGVMMTMNSTAVDESINLRRPQNAAVLPAKAKLRIQSSRISTGSDRNTYRKFSDFLQTDDMTLYENLPDRMSTSSDSTIYSEIDTNGGGNNCQDNLYEDLDKFRKNIHKLLGIPHDVPITPPKVAAAKQTNDCLPQSQSQQKPRPPPLPPRRYKECGSSTDTESNVRRKDVMKYLGANVNSGERKHKNIYQYLGIPTMALSQPAGINHLASTAESTYDVPVRRSSTLSRKSSTISTTARKCSRTYVRVPSASTLTREQSASFAGADVGKSSSKKKRMTFLRRKSSKDGSPSERRKSSTASIISATSSSTYVSYDLYKPEDWKQIDKSSASAVVSTPSLAPPSRPPPHHPPDPDDEEEDYDEWTPTTTTSSLHHHTSDTTIAEERDVIAPDEEQHYCVPLNMSNVALHQPLYVNLAALQLEASTSAEPEADKVATPSIRVDHVGPHDDSADNYLDMAGVRTSSEPSEYMSLESNKVPMASNSDEESTSTNPLAILESVISCIDELRAIYRRVPDPQESSDDQTMAAEVVSASENGQEQENEEEQQQLQQPSSSPSSAIVSDGTSSSNSSDQSPPLDGLILRERLSSYIDQLFSPENIGIGDDVAVERTKTVEDQRFVGELTVPSIDENTSEPEVQMAEGS